MTDTPAIRAVLYARRSPDEGAAQSVEGQLAALRAAAEARGWEVVEEVCDTGERGADFTRGGVVRLTGLIEAGRVDAVLATSQDRYHRDDYAFETWLREVVRPAGVQLHTLGGPLTDETPFAWQARKGESAYAELHSRISSWKARLGTRARLERGYWCGRAPLGYQVRRDAAGDRIKGELCEDPQWWPLVEEIFSRVAAGERMQRLAREFNERGLRTPEGRRFSQPLIRSIVTRRLYRGQIESRGELVRDPATGQPVRARVEPVIEAAVWEAAQPRGDRGRPARHVRLLGGLIVAPQWEVTYPEARSGESARLRSTNDWDGPCYALAGRENYQVAPRAGDALAPLMQPRYSGAWLEDAVLDLLQGRGVKVDVGALAAAELRGSLDRERRALIARLGAARRELAEAKAAVLQALSQDLGDLARELDEGRRRLKAEVGELAERLERLDGRADQAESATEGAAELVNVIGALREGDHREELKALLRAWVERVELRLLSADPPEYGLTVRVHAVEPAGKHNDPTA